MKVCSSVSGNKMCTLRRHTALDVRRLVHGSDTWFYVYVVAIYSGGHN